MDLEQLNKTQIILLTLLVSFVTSIATGIITVSLVEQAPPEVVRTINRVVERTVETIVPAAVENTQVVTREKEVTVVVKEDDLITDSIETNKIRTVRLFVATDGISVASSTATGTNQVASAVSSKVSPGTFLGHGAILTKDGLVVTDKAILPALLGKEKVIIAELNGSHYDVAVVRISDESPLSILKLITSTPSFTYSKMANARNVKLGQTVIELGGKERTSIQMGVISGLFEGNDDSLDSEAPQTFIDTIETNISSSNAIGSPLINIFGELVGIKTKISALTNGYTSADLINRELIKMRAEEESGKSVNDEVAETS